MSPRKRRAAPAGGPVENPVHAEPESGLRNIPSLGRPQDPAARSAGTLAAEIAAEWAIMTLIEEKIDRFLLLDDRVLDLLEARGSPAAPVHEVGQ